MNVSPAKLKLSSIAQFDASLKSLCADLRLEPTLRKNAVEGYISTSLIWNKLAVSYEISVSRAVNYFEISLHKGHPF